MRIKKKKPFKRKKLVKYLNWRYSIRGLQGCLKSSYSFYELNIKLLIYANSDKQVFMKTIVSFIYFTDK